MIRLPLALALAAAIAQASAPPPGLSRTVLIDNPSVLVTRLGYEAGKGETSHTHPFPAAVMQLTAGEVDMTVGPAHSRRRDDAGTIWFIPAGVAHAAVNAGTVPFEQIAIAIKPARPPAPAAAATEAPAGITRTMLLDNAETRIVRVQFAPGAREPMHAHPNDLVTVQITSGDVEIVMGAEKTAGARTPGEVRFVPRDVPHAYANVGSKPTELLSVAIK